VAVQILSGAPGFVKVRAITVTFSGSAINRKSSSMPAGRLCPAFSQAQAKFSDLSMILVAICIPTMFRILPGVLLVGPHDAQGFLPSWDFGQ